MLTRLINKGSAARDKLDTELRSGLSRGDRLSAPGQRSTEVAVENWFNAVVVTGVRMNVAPSRRQIVLLLMAASGGKCPVHVWFYSCAQSA